MEVQLVVFSMLTKVVTRTVLFLAARYLQNLTVQQTNNILTTQCLTAKSDIAVSCQISILGIDQYSDSHVDILFSNTFAEAPYSNGNTSVIAKAVDIHGAPLENYTITCTLSLSSSYVNSGAQYNGKQAIYAYRIATN